MDSQKTTSLLEWVEAYCQKRGTRFTAPRRAVLRVISESDAPLGAYEILERLKTDLEDPKPPTVYRAISFLEQHHFIHRIESLNAYVICDVDHRHSGAQFIICDQCRTVTEIHECALPEMLQSRAQTAGFTPTHWMSELHGICAACQKQDQNPPTLQD